MPSPSWPFHAPLSLCGRTDCHLGPSGLQGPLLLWGTAQTPPRKAICALILPGVIPWNPERFLGEGE